MRQGSIDSPAGQFYASGEEIEKVGEDRIFMTLPTAVLAYEQAYRARHGEPPPGVYIPRPPA